MTVTIEPAGAGEKRLLSLDVFRGLTLFLLVAEGTRLYHHLLAAFPEGSWMHALFLQFHHHPWAGLRFWDLIQPFFMFIVGVAMVYSMRKRQRQGHSQIQMFRHILQRCVILFCLGIVLHCGYAQRLVWELWNVLTQLSFTIMIAFLLMRLPVKTQLVISFGLILLTEILYRSFGVSGFDQPFVQGHNFGAWMDLQLMGKINSGGWVAVNCIPTTAHTIWGVAAGRVLAGNRQVIRKVWLLAGAGLLGLIAGYALHWTEITPIIKRICTSSFILVSGGWCLLTLAFLVWLIDIQHFRKGVNFFSIVGMNSIFIYLFSQTAGSQWLNGFTGIFTNGLMESIGIPFQIMMIITACIILAIEWGLCFFLWKKNIFIRI